VHVLHRRFTVKIGHTACFGESCETLPFLEYVLVFWKPECCPGRILADHDRAGPYAIRFHEREIDVPGVNIEVVASRRQRCYIGKGN